MQQLLNNRHVRLRPRVRLAAIGLIVHGAVISTSLRAQPLDAVAAAHGFADADGVKIHYVAAGSGPLIVMVHGFPDYWFTWRKQMPALARHYQVVAVDQRGYNRSDQPEGVDHYRLDRLTNDIRSVIQHFKRDRAIVVGHDWGGAVAWSLAMNHPELVERLIILNLPHPNGLLRELANNPQQHANSKYAREFQKPCAEAMLSAEALSAWVTDEKARPHYIEAFRRSSFEGMLDYYRANYPREPYTVPAEPLPKVKCPVLMIHGLKDEALLPGALNNTWDWLEKDFTLVTLPEAGHFVQQDAPEHVTQIILRWLGHAVVETQ
jgi:pimeloyl-ACP methyl ester carboxylesterase